MKKLMVACLVCCLAAALLVGPAEAGKKKKKRLVKTERVVEIRYENPSIGSYPTGGVGVNYPSAPTAATETYVSVEVIDDANPNAGVRLRWDPEGDGTFEGTFVCGATSEPLAIPGGSTIEAWPYIGGDPAGCPGSSATTGTVKFTFSNMP